MYICFYFSLASTGVNGCAFSFAETSVWNERTCRKSFAGTLFRKEIERAPTLDLIVANIFRSFQLFTVCSRKTVIKNNETSSHVDGFCEITRNTRVCIEFFREKLAFCSTRTFWCCKEELRNHRWVSILRNLFKLNDVMPYSLSCVQFPARDLARKDSNAKMNIFLTPSVVLMSYNLIISIFKCKYRWRISNATKSRSFHYFANKLKKQFHSESLLEFRRPTKMFAFEFIMIAFAGTHAQVTCSMKRLFLYDETFHENTKLIGQKNNNNNLTNV